MRTKSSTSWSFSNRIPPSASLKAKKKLSQGVKSDLDCMDSVQRFPNAYSQFFQVFVQQLSNSSSTNFIEAKIISDIFWAFSKPIPIAHSWLSKEKNNETAQCAFPYSEYIALERLTLPARSWLTEESICKIQVYIWSTPVWQTLLQITS